MDILSATPYPSRAEIGLSLVEQCANGSDLSEIISDFLTAIRAFGFDACAAGAWVGIGHNRMNRFYFNNWPEDWQAIYRDNNLLPVDPIVSEARRRHAPFLWSEVPRERRLTGKSAAVFALGDAYGWTEGLVVPLHGPGGYQGAVSFAALRPLRLDARDRAILHMMALAVHDRCRTAAEQPLPLAVLTPRERQCMQWAAAGKSDKQIAGLLGISQVTAHFHIEQVKKKLKTQTRTGAVALLTAQGSL